MSETVADLGLGQAVGRDLQSRIGCRCGQAWWSAPITWHFIILAGDAAGLRPERIELFHDGLNIAGGAELAQPAAERQ